MDSLKNFPIDPVSFIYGAIAIFGGVARYLRGYADGTPFNMKIFLASAFVSGFSGWMFATLGSSMAFPESLLFIMAGIGGFFGDQTMKLILEYFQRKIA